MTSEGLNFKTKPAACSAAMAQCSRGHKLPSGKHRLFWESCLHFWTSGLVENAGLEIPSFPKFVQWSHVIDGQIQRGGELFPVRTGSSDCSSSGILFFHHHLMPTSPRCPTDGWPVHQAGKGDGRLTSIHTFASTDPPTDPLLPPSPAQAGASQLCPSKIARADLRPGGTCTLS